MVYQSYEEYGEDRYLMLFQEGTSTSIGGVRSARPWFVRWAAEYKALYGYYPEHDSYVRLVDGKLQLDPANNQQVYARNIVVMIQAVSPDYVDSNGTPRANVGNTGSG
jgi:hypothetical protein